MKPKVYIETSIPSYLTARQNNDIRSMANQNTTIEWWENRRLHFEVFISEFVIAESSQGHPDASARRLAAIDGIPELEITDDVRKLAIAFIDEGSLPAKSEMDAYHISVATINGMD